jgi:hypothetical protein
MSKCGYCGEDFGSKSHMVLECRANRIPTNLYDRMCVWMANEESPEEFYESFDGELGILSVQEAAEVEQTEEAMDIMYELIQIYNKENH